MEAPCPSALQSTAPKEVLRNSAAFDHLLLESGYSLMLFANGVLFVREPRYLETCCSERFEWLLGNPEMQSFVVISLANAHVVR